MNDGQAEVGAGVEAPQGVTVSDIINFTRNGSPSHPAPVPTF